MKPLTIEELKALEVGDWVWIVRKEENQKGYGEIVSLSDDEIELHSNFFWLFFDLSDYGTKWLAYKNKECAEAKGEISELPYPERMYKEQEIDEIILSVKKAIYNNSTYEPNTGEIISMDCDEVDHAAEEAADSIFQKGFGYIKQAVKEFAEKVLKLADEKAVFQKWYDYEQLGGRLIGMDALKCVIDNLITELYGADE